MTVTSELKPKKRAFGQRVRDAVDAYPDVVAIGTYALVAAAAAVTAYFAIFALLQGYDDEGTLLVTVKAFAHGGTLYRDIYSVYGPFYYEVFGGFFSLTGSAVTTDASRSIVIVVWIATSLLMGLVSQRLTGRLALGVVGMIAAFAALGVLVNEPMHPQGLCVLLVAAIALLAVVEPRRRVGWLGGACGALVGALLLTKVNLGAFAIAAFALAAVWTVGPLYRRLWLRLLVTAAFLALPTAVMARDLNLSWVRELIVLMTLAMVATLVAARPRPSRGGEDERKLVRWILAGLAGFVAAFAVILAAILLTGPSPGDVYDGIVTQALRIRDLLVLQFQFPSAALDWAIAAVAAAVLTTRLRAGPNHAAAIWSGLLRGAAGLTILLAVAHIVPFGLNPSAAGPVTVPLVLAWVAAVPRPGVQESAHKRFLRLLLPALAVAEALQVYPVGGSQTGIASFTFIPVGALCLGDALSELGAWAAARGSATFERLRATLAVAVVALAGMFALDAILLPGASSVVLYREQTSLRLPGAGLMHLPAPTVETYVGVVDLLHKYQCSTFIGYPNTNSLYLWSGLEAPVPEAPNAWMKALDRSQQQRVVDELRATPRPCAIRNEELAGMYLPGGEPPPDLPLVDYVLHDFRSVATVGGYEFMLPKPSATGG